MSFYEYEGFRKVMNDGDVGTRLEHTIDLFELWNDTLTTLQNSENRFATAEGERMLRILSNSIKLLQRSMMDNYNESMYGRAVNRILTELKEDENWRNSS